MFIHMQIPHAAWISKSREKYFPRPLMRGAGGNRTRVQKTIHCTSTIIAAFFGFPPADGKQQPSAFGSFILRPYAQSLAYVVSHISRCQEPGV